MSDKDKKKTNGDAGNGAAAVDDPTNGQPDATETAVAKFFSKIFEQIKPQAAATGTDAVPAKPKADDGKSGDDTPDINAVVNAAVERQFAAMLSPDSPVVKGLGAAFTASIAPITEQLTALNARVSADDAAHRKAQIQARLDQLVIAGRLTPALAKTNRDFLFSAGAALTDEAITDYLDGLAKSAPLNLATSAIDLADPETGEMMELPAELNPPPGSGMQIRDLNGLRIVASARAKAEEAGGTAEQKYRRMREEIYRASGEGRGRSTLAFSDSPSSH